MKEHEYWESLGKSACPDDIARDLSIEAIKKWIPKNANILDLGCGNGYCTFKFNELKNASILGVDYSSSSVEAAKKFLQISDIKNKNEISFKVGSALDLSDYYKKFNTVITIRCLINVGDFDKQVEALRQIHKSLDSNGIYLMCENVISGLSLTNKFRSKIGLSEIKTRWHNNYLDEEKFIPEIKKLYKIIQIDHFCSTYFFISRIVNAWLANQKGEEPKYNDPINEMAAKLPNIGEFAPMRLFILEKKNV